MLGLQTEQFEQVIVGLEPPCESVYHGTDHPKSRLHDGPAAWLQVGPCSHTTGYRCDPVVQYLLARSCRDSLFHWACDLCHVDDVPGQFIPLH